MRLTSRVVIRAVNSEAVMAKRCGVGGWAGLVMAMAVLLPGPASACDTPVYRYALERWQPDDFLLVAPASAQKPLRKEIDALASRVPRANVAVLDPVEAEQIGRQADPDRMVLLAPPDKWQPRKFKEVWSGPPTAAALARLADSPARRELAKRLITGEAIVWVVVERGEAGDADGLKKLDPLITEFIRNVVAQDEARKDEPSLDDPDAPALKPSDKAIFWPPRMSVLRVRADDPQEREFTALLTAAGDPEDAGVSAVFPVFGCGRTLGGLRLADLKAEVFLSACDFLTGACSCEVKEISPGSDLLVAADWNAVPRLIPRHDEDAFADSGQVEKGIANPAESAAAAPKPTGDQPATATAPPAGRPAASLVVWLAGAAGLLLCLAWRARAGR
jgi:hypothetical protein